MKLKTLTCGLAIAAVLHGQAVAQDAAPAPSDTTTVVVKADKPNGRHVWMRAESQHFIVYSDTSHGVVNTLLDKLEGFNYVLRKVSQLDTDAATPKLTLYYLSDARDLTAIDDSAPHDAVGLYTSCSDGVSGFAVHGDYKAGDEPVDKQPEDAAMVAIFQAYARHFFYAHFPQRTPQWYIEGYANYFSTVRFDGNEAIVGLPPAALDTYMRGIDLNRFKAQMDWRDVLLDNDLYHAGGSDGVRPSPEVLPPAQIHNQLELRGNAALVAQARISYEYAARSWLLTHWIMSSHTNLGNLQTYLARRDAGDMPLQALKTAFNLSDSSLQNTLRNHLRDITAGRTRFEALPTASVAFSDLPPAGEKLLLWNAELDACPTQAHGREVLANVRHEAANFPNDDFAQASLARAEVLYGEPARALPWLQAHVAANPSNADAQALLGRAELILATVDSGDGQDAESAAAVAAYGQAARLDPQSAAAAYGYARARIFDTGRLDDDAAGAAVMAWNLAPEVDAYAFNAALAYAYAGKRDEAVALLKPIALDPRLGAWSQPAAAWISKLKGVATHNEIASAMLDRGPDGAAQREWTSFWPDVLADVRLLDGQQDLSGAKSRSDDAIAHMSGRHDSTAPVQGQRDASQE